MRSLMLVSLAMALCLFATGKATAGEINLVANGGFETGDYTSWTTTPSSEFDIDLFNHTGNFSAVCISTVSSPGSLSQMINTQAGIQYFLSFYVNVLDDNLQGINNSLEVYFDGVLQLTRTDVPTDADWVKYTFIVVGNGSPQELRFDMAVDSGFYNVDDISVCAVPVPAGFIMAGMGALGLAGMHLRRRALARKAQLA